MHTCTHTTPAATVQYLLGLETAENVFNMGHCDAKDLGKARNHVSIRCKHLGIKNSVLKNQTVIMTQESIQKNFFSLITRGPFPTDQPHLLLSLQASGARRSHAWQALSPTSLPGRASSSGSLSSRILPCVSTLH